MNARLEFWRASLPLVGWLAFVFPVTAETYSVRWQTNSGPPYVEVTGISKKLRTQLQANPQSELQKLLSVYASQGDFAANRSVPPMLGDYSVEKRSIRFQPKFPLTRGVVYCAVFRPSKLPGASGQTPDVASTFRLPPLSRQPTTVVTQIFPSADELPENLLKFYVHFSAPMQGGHIYDFIHLRNEAGKLVELPFLEIDEELWNPEMTRLTLFIDPGRIKRGVQPLEEIGPALEAGKKFVLEIDAAWRDGEGRSLREGMRKSFRVSAPDRTPPDPKNWKIESPNAGTQKPLTIDFSEPMDHALALRVIRAATIRGEPVEGVAVLSDHEKKWTFTPQKNWRRDVYQIEVQNTIEDLAGNNIGKAFEVDLFEGVQRRFTNQVVKLPFTVK